MPSLCFQKQASIGFSFTRWFYFCNQSFFRPEAVSTKLFSGDIRQRYVLDFSGFTFDLTHVMDTFVFPLVTIVSLAVLIVWVCCIMRGKNVKIFWKQINLRTQPVLCRRTVAMTALDTGRRRCSLSWGSFSWYVYDLTKKKFSCRVSVTILPRCQLSTE